MKDVGYRRLIIDRSKTGKVGTFKDISLFGNFKFPTDGPYQGGIKAQSIAGHGKVVSGQALSFLGNVVIFPYKLRSTSTWAKENNDQVLVDQCFTSDKSRFGSYHSKSVS